MDKNYKLRVFGSSEEEPNATYYYQELGQAIIGAKWFGHNEYKNGRNPKEYCWYIKNMKEEIERDEISCIYGQYTKEGKPTINEIKTFE